MDCLIELFFFCGVIYYFLSFRANNMVDVLPARIQTLFNSFESRTNVNRGKEGQNTPINSKNGLRRAGHNIQRKRLLTREHARQARDTSLFNIKECEPLSMQKTEHSPSVHFCCENCTPSSKESLVSTISKQYQVHGVNFLLINSGKFFNHLSHVFSATKYDYPRVTSAVLNDERLKEAIRSAAQESANTDGIDVGEAYKKAEERAKSILSKLQSSISDRLLRITAWLFYKLLPCFIQSAVVQTSQLDVVKKANDSGLPLVFLPLHRSHLDYIMISFLTITNNIRSPLIAAGDNLAIPIFGRLMSGLGAFFIKRRIDPIVGRKDVLYRATLHTYIIECLRAGHFIEFFIEGGRTRTGKPCMPKGGILSVIVDAYFDGVIEDAHLIPVSMNYERLVDGNFVREQLGKSKEMETFGSAIKAIWSTIMGNYGIVKVNFCQPFSLREMIRAFQSQMNRMEGNSAPKLLKSNLSTSSLYGTDVVLEDQRQLIDNIGRHIVYDCSKSTPIMSTNVVAFLLLNRFRDGCNLDELVKAFDSLTNELSLARRDLAFCGESIDIINHALDILGPGLVKQEQQEIEAADDQDDSPKVVMALQPVAVLPNVIELAYYSNTVLIHYIMESALVTGLYAILQTRLKNSVMITDNISVFQHDIVEYVQKVCDLLRYEFIFCKPCEDLEQVIAETIRKLSYSDIITLKEEPLLEDEKWCQRYAHQFDNDDSDEETYQRKEVDKLEYKINLDEENSKKLEFYHTLLRPFIDTYTFTAVTLKSLVGTMVSEKDLVQEVLKEIQLNVENGVTKYGESSCVDAIKNSLKHFEKNNVLECYVQENIKMYYLKPEFDNAESINRVYEDVEIFRWKGNIHQS